MSGRCAAARPLRLDIVVERNKALLGLAATLASGALMMGLVDRVWIVPVVASLAWVA